MHASSLSSDWGSGGPWDLGASGSAGSPSRDEIRAVLHILEEGSLVGPVNASSPAPLTNSEFAKALGRVVHRPAVIRVPSPALRIVLGRELADELVLASQRVGAYVYGDQRFHLRGPVDP